MEEGYVHSIERGAVVDGPGMRMVVFTTGCPLTCKYCHNPDTQKLRNGVLRSVADIMAEIEPYKPFLMPKSGGVTISGGEPLVQIEFCRNLLVKCKELGLHTAIDTSGFLGVRADNDLLALVDLVLLDIKSGIPEIYKKVTGCDLAPTLTFAKRLEAMHKPVWVRFVLVPGLTDSEENVRAVGSIVASLTNVERLEVLPFHKMGETKWKELGCKYELFDTPEARPDDVARAVRLLKEAGVMTALLR